MKGTSYTQLLPGHRALLFAEFSRALEQGAHFPGVFEQISEQVPACYQQGLKELNQAVLAEPERPLLQHLKESGLFLPWELRFLTLGLATMRIPQMAARICDYYAAVEPSSRRLALLSAWGMGITLLFVGLSGLFFWPWAMAAVLLALLAKPLARIWLFQWSQPDTFLWSLLEKGKPGRSCLVLRSLHQYLLNLGLCVQSGQTMERSTQLCADAEPVARLRDRYKVVASDVAGGAALSKAVAGSGMLMMARLERLPVVKADASQGLWSPGIIDAVRSSFVEQLSSRLRWVLTFLLLFWSALLATIMAALSSLL